jgi:hypothetical protein
MLGQDVAATLSPDVIVRHATPDRLPLPIEATGPKPRRWVKPAFAAGLGLVAIGLAFAMKSNPMDDLKTGTVDFATQASDPAEKTEPVSVSGKRTDSVVSPVTPRVSDARNSQPAADRQRREAVTPSPLVPPRQDPLRPVASQTASDSVPAVAIAGNAAVDSTANRGESVGASSPSPSGPAYGFIRIGPRGSGAILIVNDHADGPLTRLGLIRVPTGTVRIRLRAENCQDWDSTLTVRGGDTTIIGYRGPRC